MQSIQQLVSHGGCCTSSYYPLLYQLLSLPVVRLKARHGHPVMDQLGKGFQGVGFAVHLRVAGLRCARLAGSPLGRDDPELVSHDGYLDHALYAWRCNSLTLILIDHHWASASSNLSTFFQDSSRGVLHDPIQSTVAPRE